MLPFEHFLFFPDEPPYRQWLAFFVPQERLFILYLFSALVLAFLSYIYYRRATITEKPDTAQGFFAYVFGGGAYTHKSALQDYFFFLTNAVIFYFLLQHFFLNQQVFLSATYAVASTYLGTVKAPMFGPDWEVAAYTVMVVVAADLAIYLTHYLSHKNPILWHFHKVHHSAEVLNPMTLHRMHPVDLAFTAIVASCFIGVSSGLFFYLQGNLPEEYSLLGLNIVLFLFYIFGYNLRHSQVWFSFPPMLSRIFISPSQHQVHHSVDLKHRDKNFGLVFALWDWIFGTLYVPEHYEKIEYGISKKQKNPFDSVASLYLSPFKWTFESLRKKEGLEGIGWILATVFVVTFSFYAVYEAITAREARSVYMEELTWTETKKALADGYDTVLIPTGGTEQNGIHVALGKHNYVIRHNAGDIARRARRTLVAPVMAYVPEGDIDPPSGHMPFAGTVTVSEKIFEETLVFAAESYLAHGFRNIFFIGDSGGNQAAQEKAAAQLQKKWVKKGAIVASLGGYYTRNGQMEWLQEKGYSDVDIGMHAGIRDTSEMLYIQPSGVRGMKERIFPPQGYASGSSGDFGLASKSIGEKMTALKVKAALEEIKALRPEKSGMAEVIQPTATVHYP